MYLYFPKTLLGMNKPDDQERISSGMLLISDDGTWCESVFFGMTEYSTSVLLAGDAVLKSYCKICRLICTIYISIFVSLQKHFLLSLRIISENSALLTTKLHLTVTKCLWRSKELTYLELKPQCFPDPNQIAITVHDKGPQLLWVRCNNHVFFRTVMLFF